MFTVAYTRVSDERSTTKNQLAEIEAAGYTPTMVVEEQAVSGKVRAADRPKFKHVLDTLAQINGAMPKRLVVTRIDRLGRDAADVLNTVQRLQEMQVEVVVLQLGKVDLTSPMGQMVLATLAAVAQLERSLIVERTRAGLERVRKEGVKRIGRPPALSPQQRQEALQALADGASLQSVARRFGVSWATIQRLQQQAAQG
jgi:DNA invertase Pin-like site-specific DNA recombinase